MKWNDKWHTVVGAMAENRLVRRAVGLLLAALLGAAFEQVARLGVLPPEVVQALRLALSGL